MASFEQQSEHKYKKDFALPIGEGEERKKKKKGLLKCV